MCHINLSAWELANDRISDEELEILSSWNENVKAEIERRAVNESE